MDYSIKSPVSEAWNPGYTEAQVRMLYEGGLVNAEWLVCPHGDVRQSVTMEAFITSPSIDSGVGSGVANSQDELLISVTKDVPMTVAAMGWVFFFGALLAHFLVLLIVKRWAEVAMLHAGHSPLSSAIFTTLSKGLEALVVAGAIAALLGHAHAKITRAEAINNTK